MAPDRLAPCCRECAMQSTEKLRALLAEVERVEAESEPDPDEAPTPTIEDAAALLVVLMWRYGRG